MAGTKYEISVRTASKGETASSLTDTKGDTISLKFEVKEIADSIVYITAKVKEIALDGDQTTFTLELMSEPVWVRGEGKRVGTYAHQELFLPRWELLKHHNTFTKEQAVFLSLGINKEAFMALVQGVRSGEIDNSNAKFEIQFLEPSYEMRMETVTANMNKFGTKDGRIKRKKFYNWAKSRSIPMPDEFAPIPDESALFSTHLKKTKPVDDETFEKRIIEELEAVGVSSTDIKIPFGDKATIVANIYSDCGDYKKIKSRRMVADRITALGYESEHNTRK